jgi:hypothetical protein
MKLFRFVKEEIECILCSDESFTEEKTGIEKSEFREEPGSLFDSYEEVYEED